MKKITLSLFAACSFASAFSQVVLTQDFTAPFNPTGAGWIVQNNSIPSGTVSWTQGNQTGGNNGLIAYNGNTDDFYMADFMSVQYPGAGGISAFLISPPVTLYNGAMIQFATSTALFASPNIYPDRMQVLTSAQSAVSIPTGTTSVGTFTNLLLDINPNLSTANSSVVVGNVVNGYPMQWTVYNIPVTGVTGTVTGRFAFRYFVQSGGSSGLNSRLIGVDAVKYILPCGATAPSYTSCASAPLTINASGGLPATSYSWSTGATGPALNVSPLSTTVYTLTSIVNGLACAQLQTSTVTISGSGLSVGVSASSQTICSGRNTTLTATSAGNQYSWGTAGGTTQLGTNTVIVVSPTVTTTYTIGAGILPNCFGMNQIQITVNPSPQPSISLGPVCLGGNLVVTLAGANSYTFLGQSQNPATFALAAIGATNAAGYFFGLTAANANGCTVSGTVNFTVNTPPTVAITSTVPAVICVNRVVNLTGTGATSYTWSGAATSTNSSISYTTAAPAGNKTFNIIGIDANGCTATSAKTFSVSLCVGIESLAGNSEANVYPNPFSNELKVIGVAGRVELYNALGQLVLTSTINDSEAINTSDLTKGAYILKVYNSSNEVEKTIKLLKN
ncbi:MAG: choice-of-anchor J domain-containing protein [Bacteroidota bacterium]